MNTEQAIDDLQVALRDIGHNMALQSKEIKGLRDLVNELQIKLKEVLPIVNEMRCSDNGFYD